jgi:hypothetical protein
VIFNVGQTNPAIKTSKNYSQAHLANRSML